MRYVNLETWSRREHFKFFSGFDHPHFNICTNVDLTAFYPAVKQRRVTFTVAIVYLIARAANAIPEFRYRIRQEAMVEHEVVHPSTTILTKDDLFGVWTFDYVQDFSSFAAQAAERIARAQERTILENAPGRDDLLYMTAIPWVSFTSFTHPMRQHPADYIPRFAWGKTFEENRVIKLPLSVQGHHELMDGIHIGRLYMVLQDLLAQPDISLQIG